MARQHRQTHTVPKRPRYAMGELLFAQPSFWEGISSLMSWGAALPEYDSFAPPEVVDRLAIAADWRAVGLDLWQAMGQTPPVRPVRPVRPVLPVARESHARGR